MTLDEMCVSAARYSDRYDEFEKNEDGEYEDDALMYFNVFKDAINEAYMAVSREFAAPDTYQQAKVGSDLTVDLSGMEPAVYAIKDVLNANRTAAVSYTFETKYVLKVSGVNAGDTITLYYHYIPDRLEDLNDEPIFTEAVVDPMVYICLAVARIWMSEKKFDYANQWLSQYYTMLKSIRSSLKSRGAQRIPRRSFR